MSFSLVLVKILIGIAYGAFLGLVVVPLSKKLILSRSEDPGDTLALMDKKNKIIFVAVGIVSSIALLFIVTEIPLLIRDLFLLIPMFSIAIVDALIRKIPNPLLLAMIIIQAVYLTYICVDGKTTTPLITAAFGFAFGFIGCTIPSIFRIPVGAGDIKYSAVIGLCIYLSGYLQSMIIMGLIVLVLYVILKITKRGGMKTMIPMGPFLSIGTVITMCFPLLDSLVAKVNMF